jgi:hypothetical protein
MTIAFRLVEGDRNDNRREFCVDSTNEFPAGAAPREVGLYSNLLRCVITQLAHL